MGSLARALLAIAASLLIRIPLDPILGVRRPYLTLFGGVALAIWMSGWRAASIAAIAGFLAADYFFADPPNAIVFDAFFATEFLVYALSAGLIIFFGETMHRARAVAEHEAGMRRRAEEAERQQKEALRITLHSIGDAVVTTDASGRVTDLNPVAAALTGWSSADAAGRPLPEVFRIRNEETGDPVENPVEKVLRTGTVVGLANHTVLESATGRVIPIDDSAAPIRNEAGDLLGVVLVFRDVTEQRAAHRATTQLAAIVEHSGDAIMTKSLDGVILTWNESAADLFGYRAGEIVGEPVAVLVPPDRLREEQEILSSLKSGKAVERLETVRLTKDGREVPVALTVSPLRDAYGEIVGASTVAHDISDVVAARAALLQEKELLRTTLASIGDAVITTDEEGRVTYLNRIAEELTGWPLGDAAGLPLEDVFRIVNDDSRETVDNPAIRALRDGVIVGLTNHTVLIQRDGAERPIDDSAAPIRDVDGGISGCVLVFRDISSRRSAEHERQRLLDSERAARREAESAGRIKDEFLATLSHELRTPLNAILGWSHVINQNPENAQAVADGITVIIRNARAQADLIAELLDMNRIISGKLRLEVEDVDLAVVVQAGIDAVRHSANAKSILIESSVECKPQHMRGDASRLQQVIWNLLSNAVRFTPAGGRIQVSLSADAGTARLVVADSGEGIAPDFLPHVFERFRQGDATEARHHGGLGLGLAIVKQLVELHGGSVRASSDGKNRGSTFTVELPLGGPAQIRESVPTTRPISEAQVMRPVSDADLRGLHVLVIDDQEDTRELLGRILGACHATVTLASSAGEGMAALTVKRPDVVLCDIGMAGRDGYQFIRDVRTSGDGTPALAVTAFARSDDRLRALSAGYQGHVAKPFEPSELIASILAIARRPGGEGTSLP